jgi:ribonuclease G
MVLPGESLAKYGQQSPVPVAAAVEPAEPDYQKHGFLQDVESAGPIPRQIERQEAPVPVETHAVAAPVMSPAAEIPPAVPAEDVRRFESMNVATVFGGSVAEPSDEAAQHIVEVEEQIEEMAAAAPEAASSPASGDDVGGREGQPWLASGAGVMEEEEIDDEESDIPGFEEDHDLADFDELEEEVLGPSGDQMVPMGRELTEAVRDAHVNEQATGQYEAEGLEAQDELDESGEIFGLAEEDMDAGEEGEEGAHDPEDLEGASAEQRAPGTAGYQQRTERRPQDRRGGRRGPARRMRGRPRQHTQRQMPVISDLLKEGQEILVQIAKEPIAKKGARITSHIALPGRYVVYMPTVHHTGVSRKIATEEERHRLKRIAMSERGEAPGGFIVRTAAAGAEEQDLRADIRFLVNLWNEIRGRAETSKAPALIYHDLNLVERILRDQVSTNFSAIWADTEQEYERILRFVSRFQPSLVKRVKLYSKDTPLFEQFNITDEINKALKSKVWLRSGGYIVINQTEALVAIDINTGKYVGKTARLEDTIVKTNIDAIKEIVRQIRLRDLGGIIVIDFIDMDERRNRQKVMQALEEALKADRAPSKVLQFNDFGLVAITRKRVKQSLERTLGQPCPTCAATGMIKSVTTVCNEIYVEMRKMARHFERDVMVRVNPEVAKALKGNNGRWLQEMEELVKQTVLVKSDALLHPEQFDIQ